jgi:hypothetical protein
MTSGVKDDQFILAMMVVDCYEYSMWISFQTGSAVVVTPLDVPSFSTTVTAPVTPSSTGHDRNLQSPSTAWMKLHHLLRLGRSTDAGH